MSDEGSQIRKTNDRRQENRRQEDRRARERRKEDRRKKQVPVEFDRRKESDRRNISE